MAAAVAGPALARDVTLNGEYGCPLFRTQERRLELARLTSVGSMLRAQGRATADTDAEAARATQELVDISNTECAPLKGRFKVLERREVPGGEAVRIEPTPGARAWVLGPF